MKKNITDVDGFPRVAAVRGREEDGARVYDAKCSCGFGTYGWGQKKLAEARMEEHQTEHETGEPVRELYDFRADHGLNGDLPPDPTIDWGPLSIEADD